MTSAKNRSIAVKLCRAIRIKSTTIYRTLFAACLIATFLATAASESGYNFTACMAVVFASLGGAAVFGWMGERSSK